MHTHIHTHTHVHIYIYIQRNRGGGDEGDTGIKCNAMQCNPTQYNAIEDSRLLVQCAEEGATGGNAIQSAVDRK